MSATYEELETRVQWIEAQHESLKAKVREIVRIAKCTDGECSNEAYMKMWAELEEVVK